jgi:hypothetical protein
MYNRDLLRRHCMASKLPSIPKGKPWSPLHYALKTKSDEKLEKLKAKSMLARQEKAKSVKWKDISKYNDKSEYEVYASNRYIGTVKQEGKAKWKIYPEFEYEDLFYSYSQLHAEYYDFRESGKALIDFWITSV